MSADSALTFESTRSRTVAGMTDTYTIAEVARRSGFPASTLRYYEDVGLVRAAGRTDAGYRIYDDRSLAKLAFVARAKQLGCTLDEIADLVTAWEGERCEPVQDRLRGLVDAKITETQTRLGEMVAFTAQLHEAAAALRAHTPDGPCDDDCGCTTTVSTQAGPTAVVLTDPPPSAGEAPIACTLAAADMAGRLEAWREALEPVVDSAAIDGGVRLTFAEGTRLARVADLAAAERDCCIFFRFAVTVDDRGAALEVTAPPEAQDLVNALVGAAS